MSSTTPGGAESPARNCRACAKPVPAGVARCPNCGFVEGKHLTCPHCRTEAEVEPSAALRWVCTVCGRPRVPVDDAAIERSYAETADLAKAGRARNARGVLRVGAALAAAFGAFSGLVLLLVVAVAHPSVLATVLAAAAVAVPFLVALLGLRRANRNGAEMTIALDDAWMRVAAEIARARGGVVDARALATLTRVDEATAEEILARMSVRDLLGSYVSADGRLNYGLNDGARVRVDTGEPPADEPPGAGADRTGRRSGA